MTEVEWRRCLPPYDRYLVSETGLFKNGDTGQIKKVHFDKRGKPRVNVFVQGDRGSSARYFHILMWKAFYGEIPKGYYVMPIDGIWSHLELENWELVSHSTSNKRAWGRAHAEQDRLYEEAMSEFDDYIFGSCIESEEERRSRLR